VLADAYGVLTRYEQDEMRTLGSLHLLLIMAHSVNYAVGNSLVLGSLNAN
jgi:hypothetical protein